MRRGEGMAADHFAKNDRQQHGGERGVSRGKLRGQPGNPDCEQADRDHDEGAVLKNWAPLGIGQQQCQEREEC